MVLKCTYVNIRYSEFFVVGNLYKSDGESVSDEFEVGGYDWYLEDDGLTIYSTHDDAYSDLVAKFEPGVANVQSE